MSDTREGAFNRRDFVRASMSAAALTAFPASMLAAAEAESDKSAVLAQIPRMHADNVRRLQEWIALPAIAAENRNYPQGAEYMAKLARDAGFTGVKLVETSGKPGVFGRLDAGAPTTVGIYFMYDVKQFVPEEWSSPPLEGRLVQKAGLGTVCMGRGAVNQKGPENSFLSALMAFKAAGRKLPVNLVLVCEGEEEIASPHFSQIVMNPEVLPHLKKCIGVWMPEAAQDRDGGVQVNLGAKGVVEMELISSGQHWGRGSTHDIHSSEKARLDSPAWRLVKALQTLVSDDGQDPFPGYGAKARPLSDRDKALIAKAAATMNEAGVKKLMDVQHWVHDVSWQEALERLASVPTINIEGLVSGYTGVGGKTIMPGRAVAKVDTRLVPDMTAAEAAQAIRNRLDSQGFSDIEMKVSGGYDPTTTPLESSLIQTELKVYRSHGIEPVVFPRLAGSWPGYLFTGAPLHLPAGHFGLGHGNGAHAPNEYYVIESSNPKVQGIDGAVKSYVDFLYAFA